MKKYIYRLFIVLVTTVTMVSCTEDEGTTPGNDSKPAVTIYQYEPEKPYNPDNDVIIRFATNNKTTEAYYLLEKTADKSNRLASGGEDAYMDYVVSNGVKLNEVSGEVNVDVTLTDLYGDYTITAVAVGNNMKTAAETTFSGLDWDDVATGTYYFEVLGLPSKSVVLQVCTTDATLYRFKDVFGDGLHIKINLIDYKGVDEDGEYQFFRVPPTETSLVSAEFGTVYLRDIGYWQGNDSFVTEGGYESGMYENYDCFIFIQYYATGANFGYNYDFFIAD